MAYNLNKLNIFLTFRIIKNNHKKLTQNIPTNKTLNNHTSAK